MKYEILWLQSALDELTRAWTAAPSHVRQAITKVSHEIDAQLIVNPEDQGESRPKGRRIAFFPPLGITYRVDSQNSVVFVIHVWCFRKRIK
jgi:mRNA-degrading endonuclease RelE of RelBE toxin-antitoxin system